MTDRDAPSGAKTLWKDETCHVYSIAATAQRDAGVYATPAVLLHRTRRDIDTKLHFKQEITVTKVQKVLEHLSTLKKKCFGDEQEPRCKQLQTEHGC